MFDNEKIPEELKAIENELAALRPRRNPHDPQWRAFLAMAADSNPNPADASAARPACSAPGDHLFLCVYCGAAAPHVSRVRRWAWPAAFSATAAAAAILLAMVVLQPQWQPERGTANQLTIRTQITHPSESPRQPYASASNLGWTSNTGPRWREDRLCRLAVTDPQLFDQALREFSRQPAGDSMVAINHFPNQSIPTAHELMNEMLKRPN
jgi:hypothetical protein